MGEPHSSIEKVKQEASAIAGSALWAKNYNSFLISVVHSGIIFGAIYLAAGVVAALIISFIGSLLSTWLTPKNKFQRSAMVTLLVVASTTTLFYSSFDSAFYLILLLAAQFLIMFSGYRCYFLLRK